MPSLINPVKIKAVKVKLIIIKLKLKAIKLRLEAVKLKLKIIKLKMIMEKKLNFSKRPWEIYKKIIKPQKSKKVRMSVL